MNISIQWKNKKKPPTKILEKFFEMAEIEEKENVRSVVFYSNSFEILPQYYIRDYLEFSPDKLDNTDKDELIIKTIIHCVLKKSFKPDDFIKQISVEAKGINRKREQKHLITTLSISKLPFREIKVFDSSIKFYKRFPNKFISRTEILDGFDEDRSEEHNYYKCLISTFTNSNEPSIHLKNLNILRALICFDYNYSNEYIMGGGIRKTPINRVCLGLYHSLHKLDGKFLGDSIEYEQKFMELPTIEIQQPKKFYSKILSKIEKSPYGEKLKTSLLLYVRALDEYDADIALALLWNALDKLTNECPGNYDNVIDRTKIILGDDSHHFEAITALKNVRNNYVHNMINNRKARSYCYELQAYFKHIFYFHLNNLSHLNSMADALTAIDYIGKLNSNYTNQNNMIKTAFKIHRKIKHNKKSNIPMKRSKDAIKHSSS